MKKIDLLIIGGGPAGLAAGIYAGRSELKTVIIEKNAPGGKLLNTSEIENYPGFKSISGAGLATKFLEHATHFGVEIIQDEVIDIKDIDKKEKIVILKSNEKISTKTIILAMGMNPKKLPLKEYDKYFGHGISTCVVCDGAFYRNKNIAVIGGGTSASEETIFAASIVKNVYVINLFDKFNTYTDVLSSLQKAKNVHLKYNSELVKINGDDKNIHSIVIRNTKTKKEETIEVSGIFTYIGWIPATSFLEKSKLLNKDKLILIDYKTGTTQIPGVFAAGDVAIKEYHQVSGAISEGTNSALSAKKYIDKL